jgi:hypothetical protein
MPRQENYRSDILSVQEPTFTASRIVSFPEEAILREYISTPIGTDKLDTIELHFYSIPKNVLLLSLLVDIRESDILKSHIVSYADGTQKNYLRIDFTELFRKNQITLVPGNYKMVLNFFSDMIGSTQNKKMIVQQISDSRTELQLSFKDTSDVELLQTNMAELREYVVPTYNSQEIIRVLEQIFVTGATLQDENIGITYDALANFRGQFDTIGFPDQIANRILRVGLQFNENLKIEIEAILSEIFIEIRDFINLNYPSEIKDDDLRDIIESVIRMKILDAKERVDSKINLF